MVFKLFHCQDRACRLIEGIGQLPWNRMEVMTARIYRPAKTATQSGAAKTHRWLLEFEREQAPQTEPLMGWIGSGDTKTQVKLWFDTAEQAIAYAQKHGLAYRVEQPHAPQRKTISYSDNFKSTRIGQWTH